MRKEQKDQWKPDAGGLFWQSMVPRLPPLKNHSFLASEQPFLGRSVAALRMIDRGGRRSRRLFTPNGLVADPFCNERQPSRCVMCSRASPSGNALAPAGALRRECIRRLI